MAESKRPIQEKQINGIQSAYDKLANPRSKRQLFILFEHQNLMYANLKKYMQKNNNGNAMQNCLGE
jgi:hypothetical protein